MRRPATDINSKQKRILDYITECLQTNYRCPSVREICTYMGLSSTSTVQSHLNTLERFGYITRDNNKNRSITVVGMQERLAPSVAVSEDKQVTSSETFEMLQSKLRNVPLIGTVQAGLPVTAIQNQESVVPLPLSLIGNSECFLLRVRGESMRDIGMYEGDLLIVRNQSTANNGDIVVALIDDEATVKRFYREPDRIRLQPENSEFEPIYTKNCVIEGKVIGLIRDHI
ncbi:MAG: transcriptional repressor LexA [Veillonella sp.]|uniref:transcriptional repressor LexA n=1 Tax=Veillonella sp. TaxID=1926307 RepID=UPI0025FD75D3|nr:transcriptional repressor LexA [Veillonella sp.]MBS4912741.1 transcriptional repressor LexA [Veillonella sp.]